MRGMFTCGVTDVLMEHDVAFDAAAGISAGAVFGCNLKSRQPGRAIRYNKRYCGDPRYASLRSLVTTGDLYNADFCYRELPDRLDVFDREAFAQNPMVFVSGATDIRTGRCVYHTHTDGGERDMLYLRASASMPFVSRPVAADGLLLLDGGLTDAVPFEEMRRMGYARQVLILTQPRGYRKGPQAFVSLARVLYARYPALVHAMAVRHDMYNREMDDIDRLEDEGTVLVIRPAAPLAIGHREKDPSELERVYQEGRKAALQALPAVRRFMGGDPSAC